MVERAAKVDTSNTYIHDPMNVFDYSLHLKVTEIPCTIYYRHV